ncbi:hypothetical protein DFP73DRAFT_541491 [Morchella snyderi]|nr:hypothetical protein DFP73DRAFT_541491 [Morchella snyderi]
MGQPERPLSEPAVVALVLHLLSGLALRPLFVQVLLPVLCALLPQAPLPGLLGTQGINPLPVTVDDSLDAGSRIELGVEGACKGFVGGKLGLRLSALHG